MTDPIFSDIFPYHYFGHLGGQSEVSETDPKTWELTQKSSLYHFLIQNYNLAGVLPTLLSLTLATNGQNGHSGQSEVSESDPN